MLNQSPIDHYVKVGQVNTRYVTVGEQGKPVIMIHGLGGFLENWFRNISALAQTHRVYTVDLVGFGRSDKPQVPYSYEHFANFIGEFMDQLELPTASLIGNSMGGGVALQFALLHPERVDSLVLVSSAGFGRRISRLLQVAALPILGELLMRPSRTRTQRILRTIIHDQEAVSEDMVDQAYEIATLPGTRRAFLSTLRNLKKATIRRDDGFQTWLEQLGTIQTPSLIVWGKQDQILPVEDAYQAEKLLPTAKLHVFDNCGHVPMIERPEEFNELVLDFLDSVGA